jgi:peptidoglycan hydrolase CwlO-like protein
MDFITNLFTYIPEWLAGAFSVLIIMGIVFWRLFGAYVKMTKTVNAMKEEAHKDITKMHNELREENKKLRDEISDAMDMITDLKKKLAELELENTKLKNMLDTK